MKLFKSSKRKQPVNLKSSEDVSPFWNFLEDHFWGDLTKEQGIILITLYGMANTSYKKWVWHGKPHECAPGQMITSVASIQKRCGSGINRQHVRTALEKFKKLNFLTEQVTNHNRLVTLLDYSSCGINFSGANQQTNQRLTNAQPTANQQLTTTIILDDDRLIDDDDCGNGKLNSREEYEKKVIHYFNDEKTIKRNIELWKSVYRKIDVQKKIQEIKVFLLTSDKQVGNFTAYINSALRNAENEPARSISRQGKKKNNFYSTPSPDSEFIPGETL